MQMRPIILVLLSALALIVAGCDSGAKKGEADGHDHAAHGDHDSCSHDSQAEKAPAEKGHEGHDHASHEDKSHEGHEHGELVPQTVCPVMGTPINKDLFVDKDGKRVYVCCKECLEPLEKDFAKYLEKLHELGQKPEDI
jgi:hypothetical protein